MYASIYLTQKTPLRVMSETTSNFKVKKPYSDKVWGEALPERQYFALEFLAFKGLKSKLN